MAALGRQHVELEPRRRVAEQRQVRAAGLVPREGALGAAVDCKCTADRGVVDAGENRVGGGGESCARVAATAETAAMRAHRVSSRALRRAALTDAERGSPSARTLATHRLFHAPMADTEMEEAPAPASNAIAERGRREKKAVEHFVMQGEAKEEKGELVIPAGAGTKLGEIENVSTDLARERRVRRAEDAAPAVLRHVGERS